MGKPSRYWTWLRLYSNGTCKPQTHEDAKEFFKQQFPDMVEESTIDDKPVQTRLYDLMPSNATGEVATSHPAETCLRCFISHQVVQTCSALVAKYGRFYEFSLAEVLPWILDNEGLDKALRSTTETTKKAIADYEKNNESLDKASQPTTPEELTLSSKILSTYKPHRGSLTAWTIRLVRQDRRLTQALSEFGVYFLSDWAILNDTKLEQLPKILGEFHLLTEFEVNRATALLESYHKVYRSDRINERTEARSSNRTNERNNDQQKFKRRCADPDEEQLQRMGHFIFQETEKSFTSDELLTHLQELAYLLRQYRTHVRGGSLAAESIDIPEIQAQAEQRSNDTPDDAEDAMMEFLQAYRQEFLHCLDRALERVIRDRVQKSKTPEQGDRFRKALHLSYCQRLPMKNIAPQIGFRGQDNVTRLLKLKDFRADVRRHMLKHLLKYVITEAQNYTDSHRLQQLDDSIESVLEMLLDDFMRADAQNAQTPKEYGSGSVFAERLCQYLCQSDPNQSES